MIIHALSITEYKNCPITILQFEDTFIYLFVHRKKFYFEHQTAQTSWLNQIKWRLGFWRFPYSQDEIIKIKEVMLNGALSSIDELNKKYAKTIS